jgi:hypothetical protein
LTQSSTGADDAGADLWAQGARWALGITILESSVVFIDMTIVNLALSVMQRDFAATFQDMQWVVEAYILLLTALTLTGGGLPMHSGGVDSCVWGRSFSSSPR